ncbi:hypothetical protein L4C33_22485 [Vibrio makurazakiensis]|uniref:hypothetical protein n=1 Tax=Vibrio makurazakiensis TaxID=2910250 RepID=UPI003D1525DB
MNELDSYCEKIDLNMSNDEIRLLGWEDKEWIIESTVFLTIVSVFMFFMYQF